VNRALLAAAWADASVLRSAVSAPGGVVALHIRHGLCGSLDAALRQRDASARAQRVRDDVVADVVLLLGAIALAGDEHVADLLVHGSGAPCALDRLTALPVTWFRDPARNTVLFPTLLAVLDRAAHAKDRLATAVSPAFLADYLRAPDRALPAAAAAAAASAWSFASRISDASAERLLRLLS
jgi:hypothetical protein